VPAARPYFFPSASIAWLTFLALALAFASPIEENASMKASGMNVTIPINAADRLVKMLGGGKLFGFDWMTLKTRDRAPATAA